MFYIHHSSCISPQHTFLHVDLDSLNMCQNNQLNALEPVYDNVPPGLLRRMGKAVRIGIGTGLPLLKKQEVQGIVVGTANGGMEDCIKFLSQIIEYDEGRLTPTNFVQSTPNAIASQLSLMTSNKGYNITHTHRGLAFENAMLDVAMQLKENAQHSYLLGGIDEISTFNHAIEKLGGWYKEEIISNASLYAHGTPGTLAGEGAAMFVVNKQKQGAICQVRNLAFFHTKEESEVVKQFHRFLEQSGISASSIDVFLSGENGDNRQSHFYHAIETELGSECTIVRYKHMIGEFPSTSALALWLACQCRLSVPFPAHMVKKQGTHPSRTICLYNTYKGEQHSFILVFSCE